MGGVNQALSVRTHFSLSFALFSEILFILDQNRTKDLGHKLHWAGVRKSFLGWDGHLTNLCSEGGVI